MKIALYSCVGVVVLALGIHAEAPHAIDLMTAYSLAKAQSETLAIAKEDIAQANARYTQALGAVLPKLSVSASEVIQDADEASGNGLIDRSTPEIAITVIQPLFDGLKSVYAMRAAKTDAARERHTLDNLDRLLFLDVARAFYTVIRIESERASVQQVADVYRKRLSELGRYVALGKSRQSEAVLPEAELAALDAEIAKLDGDRRVAYDMMRFLTGLAPHPPLVDSREMPAPSPLSHYLNQVDARPDVKAAAKQVELDALDVKVSRGTLFPKAGVEANYYPYRGGYREEVAWDAAVTLSVPLANVTSLGEIRAAKSEAKQAQLALERTRRHAASEIERAYSAYLSSETQYRAYASAARKAQRAAALEEEDYRSRLVTNLDVLVVQKTWLDTLRLANSAQSQARLDWITLQIVSGLLPTQPGELK